MTPTELIGQVFSRYLSETVVLEESEGGTARFMIDHLSAEQTVEIALAVRSEPSLRDAVELRINRDFVGDGASKVSDDVLTSDPATFFRNSKCPKPILIVASTGDDEDQSLKEFVRIGADELKSSPELWVDSASSGLSLLEDHRKWWTKAIVGLCELRVIALERVAQYVVDTRTLILDEGLSVGPALGQALPALRFPKDSSFFDRVSEKTRTHKSAWHREYKRVYSKNACFLEKRTPSQLLLNEEDLASAFDKTRDEIPEMLHPMVEAFIEAPAGWNEHAEELARCEWEDVKFLFSGLRRVKLNLGESTREFFDERSPELLGEADRDYIDLLVARKNPRDPTDEDQAFYESHRNELKEDRKLRSAWDKFIYGRARECTDFLIGLASCLESLFSQAPEATGRQLTIRCHAATKRDLRDLNINALEHFVARYIGLKKLLSSHVVWDVGDLFRFPSVLEEWRNDSRAKGKQFKANRSVAKRALQLKFFLELESEALDGGSESTSTQLIWTFDPFAIGCEFESDWSRLEKHPLVRCQTELDPISSKGLYQSVSLSDVRTFQPSYDRSKGSFVPVYCKEIDLDAEFRQNLDLARGENLISENVQAHLQTQFEAFVSDYSDAVRGFREFGVAHPAIRRQLKNWSSLLTAICTQAKGDRNRELLVRPLLEIGAVSVRTDVPTVVVAPWHPLRMVALAQKARQVADLLDRLLTGREVEFGDQRLYFRDLIRELEHPFYPEVVVGWVDGESHLLSLTDNVGDYSLHEPPVLHRRRLASTHETPTPAANRVMEMLRHYITLYPHERANLSLVLFNSDSSRLPQAVVDRIGSLHESDEEVQCEIILRHTDDKRLRHLYQEIVESADEDADAYSPSEATRDFLARLRIGIQVESASTPDQRDGCPHDVLFSQDVIARHAVLEWCVDESDLVQIEELFPPRWSRRRPAADGELKTTVYLCCPVQSEETQAYLAAVKSFLKGDTETGHSRLLPARQLNFSSVETKNIFKETHDLANWVVNYDDLLDRNQLREQGVSIIRYKQSATQGKNLVISSRANTGLLRAMLKSRISRLHLNLTPDAEDQLAQRLIEDANAISGDLALRAAKRGRSANELLGVVLSWYLIQSEFAASSDSQYFGWFFLDDYAEWLGQREEQIADLMVIGAEQTDDCLQLTIVVSEAKYIEESNLAAKRRESQKQLRDTVRRIDESIFGNPDRLDRDLWLARLSDLLVDGVRFQAGQSPQISQWRHAIRSGNCRIMLRGYSHVFVHSHEFNDSNAFPIEEAAECYQEVFARAELRDLLLAYRDKDDPKSVRNRGFDDPPSLIKRVFRRPSVDANKSDSRSVGTCRSVRREPSPNEEASDASVARQSNEADEEGNRRENALRKSATGTFVSTTNDEEADQDDLSSRGEAAAELESDRGIAGAAAPDSKSGWGSPHLAELIQQYDPKSEVSDEDSDRLQEIVKKTKTGLQQYHLQAKLQSSTMTPNAALLKFAGSSHLTVEQVTKRQSEFLTTHGLNIISVQPEPGVVSIAVARNERQIVDLASVWRDWNPRSSGGGNQSIAIGIRESDGSILFLDPCSTHAPHTLIAGSTGSGKSVLMQTILLGIAATNTPRRASITLIDPKQGVDYFSFESLPHLGEGVITQSEKAITELERLVGEMESRYQRFRDARASNITTFNKKVSADEQMPTIWLIHDEFAEWMLVDHYKDAVSATVQRLGVKARAAGIYLIFAAQRPDAHVMPMQLRSNLGNRLILRVDSEGTSEISLGEKGAEKLLGKGHLLARLEGESGLVYSQVPLPSEAFVNAAIEAIANS